MPSVSIIVPIYNSEDTIGECIRSIVDQSFTDIEIILVNDGSTDRCGQICDEYAQNDARIRYFFQDNKGRSEARLNGFIHSTGDWIAFVDSDDTLPTDAIEKLYSRISDDTDIVFGNGYSLKGEKRQTIPVEDFRHLAVRAEGTIGVPWGSLYRRSVLSGYTFDIPREIYNGEDYIFWLRLIFKTEKPVNIVYELVYNKGEEHTSNHFHWTAEYCKKLNEYRKEAIPADRRKEYMPDMISDRMANMYAVAVSTPKQEWKDSEYYQELLSDINDAGIKIPFKQKLFFSMPSRWMRSMLANIREILRNKYLIFIFIVGLAMLFLNIFDARTLSDDLIYRFIFQENEKAEPQLISSFSDLFRSQYVHYFYVNGRIVVHSIAQILLSLTPSIFYKIINTILFVAMLHLSIIFIRVDKSSRLFASVSICFMLFIISSGIRTTMLWGLGAFNYLLVVVMILSFLLIIRNLNTKVTPIHFLLSPLALLIGWTHESLSFPISITLIIYIIVGGKQLIRKPILLYTFWYVLGAILCTFAPSIINRADVEMPLLNRLLSGIINFVFNVRITWLLLITLVLGLVKDKVAVKEEIIKYWYYYLTIVLCLWIVFLCGTNLERVAFYADFVSMLVLIRILSCILSDKVKNYSIITCSVIMIIFFVFAIIVRKENCENFQYMERQMQTPGKEIISVRQAEKGKSHLLDFFRNRYVNSSAEFGFYCCYMGFNSDDINMRDAAKLYGKNEMVFLPEDIIKRINNDSNAYRNYELDSNMDLYVWRMNDNRPVKRIIFDLKYEDVSKLLPHQRLVAYKEDTYVMDDDYHYSVVEINKKPYLIFTKPTTNIFRRINNIRYEYK